MQDLNQQLEKLRTDAEDCALISKLATDKDKRELFARLSSQLQKMADDVEKAIAARLAGLGSE
jgi:predicted aldo/keto reductase-like oxidoreductase